LTHTFTTTPAAEAITSATALRPEALAFRFR